jgi:hypothetical protein
MKTCKKCFSHKELNEFGRNKNEKDGLNIYCKLCEKERAKNYRENNPDKIKLSAKKYRTQSKDKYDKTIQKYIQKNPHMSSKERSRKYRENEDYRKKMNENRKKYRLDNIEKEREKYKNYYHENKVKLRKINNEYKSKKLKMDPFFRMKKNLSDRIRKLLSEGKGGRKTLDIVGLNYEDFKNYIENLFVDDMCWENYGKWHLDHIIPLYLAKNEEEILKFNHYTNLQPLWAEDNLKKNRKI